MREGEIIVLCKNFTFVGASGDVVRFDWHEIDASFTNAELVFETKAVETGTITVAIEGSMDGTIVTSLGSGTSSATGKGLGGDHGSPSVHSPDADGLRRCGAAGPERVPDLEAHVGDRVGTSLGCFAAPDTMLERRAYTACHDAIRSLRHP
jgi:hypothetical protein